MLKEMYDENFKGYDLLGHVLILDGKDDISFKEYRADAQSPAVRGLSKNSLDFLAQKGRAPANSTHVHIGDSRRVCIEGSRQSMDNYTAYSVAYLKKRTSKIE